MTDRELLELAAKAAGWTIEENGHDVQGHPWFWCHQLQDHWDPIIDDGDALRLAVKLGIHITNSLSEAWASTEKVTAIQIFDQDTDPYAATRRAIVRAAAEIGKGMK
ncbi:MAG: hypothetical protein RLZZ184_4166 [Cyanobacteriota bacterium]